MTMETKRLVTYLNDGMYCILVPVYYECEKKPAWRKCFIGSKEECEQKYDDYPEYIKATNDENKRHRENRFKEYLFLKERGTRKKEMLEIKEMYGF